MRALDPREKVSSLSSIECDRRGVRHSLFTVLSLAITGVLAGCRSLTAIWEHTTDLTAADLEALGVEAGRALPSESTIRRVLQDLDPADVDAHERCRPRRWRGGRDVLLGKPLERPAQGLLVSLDRQKVVTTPITYPLGGACLRVYGVGGDHCPVQVKGLEQVR